LLALSAHKLYAPKGTGALFVRRGVRLISQNVGGHQEREKRAGTEGVPGIVAFGTAAKLAREEMDQRSQHDQRLRDRFEAGLSKRVEDIVFNGDRARRLPHLSNISFRFIEGEGLLISLDLQGVAVSTGSACSSGTLEPSPVIRAKCCRVSWKGCERFRRLIRFRVSSFKFRVNPQNSELFSCLTRLLSKITSQIRATQATFRTPTPAAKRLIPSAAIGCVYRCGCAKVA